MTCTQAELLCAECFSGQNAEIKFEELVALNHDMNPDSLVEGQTILLPGGKLSSRDREILAGIGPATYRTYPVREGEVLQDIMEKRNITRAEMEALNPGINLDRLSSKLHARCCLSNAHCSCFFLASFLSANSIAAKSESQC